MIQENSIDIKYWYKYQKSIQSQKNSINNISNSSQPLIEESINQQAGNQQASKHPSGAKQAGGTDNKQSLIIRSLDGATGMSRLRRRVYNPTKFLVVSEDEIDRER